MKELVVISGKGGTGKTSLTASFAALATGAVLADCDVDAADLHLILAPEHRHREEFLSGRAATIRAADCVGCGRCAELCRFDSIFPAIRSSDGAPIFEVDATACEGCGVCVWNCPSAAIDFPEQVCGEWFISNTRHGTMVHARLTPGAENSGLLVALVREQARQVAKQEKRDLVLVDGPPGTGCPVIAAVTGASSLLVVTEPTVSGEHDLDRVLKLARHFRIPAAVCINKWDLHRELTERIEANARAAGVIPVGRVRYDKAATAAQRQGLAVVEAGPGPLADDIRAVWTTWMAALDAPLPQTSS